jgi:diguanylate cyclase (GGDEF)-like protein
LRSARLRQQLMGFSTYLMFLVPLAWSVREGWVRFGWAGLGALLAAAVVINLGFHLAIRSGYSERFADPSLVQGQIVAASAMGLVVSYYADEARIVSLLLFFTAFFFGIFSLGTRRYLVMAALTIASYGAMLWIKLRTLPHDAGTLRIELLYLLVLAMTLVWMALLGGYVGHLRNNLAKRRKELAAALARVQELASHDELTGMYNRRHLMELLEQQRERAQRHGEGLAVCILDLDHFKRINDAHGHLAGDDALRSFAQRVRQRLRRMDAIGRADAESSFGRYGGEEFLLLLPYTGIDGAARCVDRLRQAMHEEPLATCAGPIHMTFSAGVAEYRAGESASAVLARADGALYRATAGGRDRVETETTGG